MEFIIQNIGTIVVILILVLIVGLVIRKMYKDKKEGKACACGNSCSGCAMRGTCHIEKE